MNTYQAPKPNLFQITVEKLLSGEFICQENHPDIFKLLQNEDELRDVNDFLYRIGKRVKSTDSEEAFYLAYSSISEAEKKCIRQEFTKTKSLIQPIVEFMMLIMASEKTDAPLIAGQSISSLQITNACENSEALAHMSDNIAKLPALKLKKDRLRARIDGIFDFMEKNGYLFKANAKTSVYFVTGKIDYFYELLSFIDSRENIIETVNKAEDEQLGLGF